MKDLKGRLSGIGTIVTRTKEKTGKQVHSKTRGMFGYTIAVAANRESKLQMSSDTIRG